uniref:SRCR domain-containing protein n=1 Tax=Anas platyrhynchos platyrhynchos TaxID=8840 RepID=A0A493T1F1_ANAPP
MLREESPHPSPLCCLVPIFLFHSPRPCLAGWSLCQGNLEQLPQPPAASGKGVQWPRTFGLYPQWEVGMEVPEGSGNSQVSLVAPGFVRLVGGDSPCSGSLEVYDRDQWKAVCHSHFGAKAAEVVCRELQCGTALSVHGAAQLGEGAGPVWDRELQCVGNESTILFCTWLCWVGDRWGEVVVCSSKMRVLQEEKGTLSLWPLLQPMWEQEHKCGLSHPPLLPEYTGFRLVNGSTACEGRVEVEVLGTWGTLCASRWDLSDAHVLCRHLGCGFAESIPGGGHFGRGTGPVWRDSFHCDGTEGHLGQCPVTALGASPLVLHVPQVLVREGSQSLRVGVLPSAGSRRVRLSNGAGRCAGRVEIYYQGLWGTVCDDAWDLADAAVVCRQLGCGGALEAAGSARFGEGSGSFWQCPSASWDPQSCTDRREEASITCNGKSEPSRHQVLFPTGYGEMQRRNPEGL